MERLWCVKEVFGFVFFFFFSSPGQIEQHIHRCSAAGFNYASDSAALQLRLCQGGQIKFTDYPHLMGIATENKADC